MIVIWEFLICDLYLCKYLDTTGQPCYLDTNVEKNTLIYQKFGFEMVAADSNATPGLTWWGMARLRHGEQKAAKEEIEERRV